MRVKTPFTHCCILLAVLAAMPSAMLAANPSCTPVPSGVVSWWPAEGNTQDIIGTNNGTPQGHLTYAAGEVGQAFVFDGSTSYITVPASPSLNIGASTNGLTIEAWVNPNYSDTAAIPIIEWDSSSTAALMLWCENHHTLYANLLDTAGTPHILDSSNEAITVGIWQHVALTYDRNSGLATLYLNGAVVATNNFGDITPQSTYPVNIGRRTGEPVGDGETFDGMIDELSIYGRPLSQGEIQAIYNAGSGGKCASEYPPVITSQPVSQTNLVGQTASFSVSATGTLPLSYQWIFETTNLPGATNATLTLTNVQLGQAGNYSVLVTNLYGYTNSATVMLTVNPLSSCTPAPANLVSWWPAEGNPHDIIGTNNGMALGALGYTNGEVGMAFAFDGSSSYISIPASPSLNIGATGSGVTIEAWVKPNAVDLATPGGPVMEWDSSSAAYLEFWVSENFYANVVDTSGNSHFVQAPNNLLSTNQWQHVALTYDKTSGNAYIYLNGVAVVTNNIGTITPQTSTPANIGRRTGEPVGLNQTYGGLMDEVSIYNRALSRAEIQSIYNAGSTGKCVPENPPVIISQPASETNFVGQTASFSVGVTGTLPLNYQWIFNSTNLPGATNATLTLTNVQLGQAGNYSVLVTNLYGYTNSAIAVLTVKSVCTPAPANLVSWWPAEGNANDIIGTNNGTVVGSIGYTNGEVGMAFLFDGSSYITMPASPSLNIGATGSGVTIEGWVNPNYSDTAAIPIIEWDSSSTAALELWCENHHTLFANLLDTSGTPHTIISSNEAITVGIWQHVALTYDKGSGQVTLYINGSVVATNNFGNITPQSTYPVNIGRRTGEPIGNGETFNGLMDEVSIYNLALSQSEIQAIYNAGSAGKCVPENPPVIISQPASETNFVGQTASFSVGVTGTLPLSYQWHHSTTNVIGATNAILTLANVQLSQAGNYSVSITNAYGVTNSAVAVLVVNPAPSCTPTPANLVSWWPAEGNANDIIGTNNGTVVGTLGYTNGEVGMAFDFDGSSYITMPASSSLNIGAASNGLTIEGWVNPNYSDTAAIPIIEWDSSSTAALELWCESNHKLFANLLDTSGTPHTIMSSNEAVTVGIWQHVALTYDKSSGLATLYINGSVVATNNFGNITPQSTYPVNIGRRTGEPVGNGETFVGLMDELSIYKRALSQSEIQAIYNAGSGGKCVPENPTNSCTPAPANLVSWWPAEGNPHDIIGTNNGMALGALGYTNGEVGMAFAFDGSSSYISIPASPSLNIGATGSGVTIEAWVKPNAVDLATPGGPVMEWDSSSAAYLEFWVSENFYANVVDTSGNSHFVQAPNNLLSTNQWQHVALTYDKTSGNAYIYLNGVAVVTNNIGTITPQTSTPANIGRRTGEPVGLNQTYGGLMDEVSIYNRALSRAEIQSIYNAGSTGKCVPENPPVIISQPASETNFVGQTASFSVGVTGTLPLNYQWIFNSTNLPGATNATLTLTNVQLGQAGNYSVLVTNLYGYTNSAMATLTVYARNHFHWSTILSPRYAYTPFTVTIMAQDVSNNLVTNFTGTVALSATDGVPVKPTVSANFVNGVWTGSLKIFQPATNLVLEAVDSEGNSGLANPIDVAYPPVLGSGMNSEFMLLYWPTDFASFTLQSTPTLFPANWQPVTLTPVVIDGVNFVSLPSTDESEYFRLYFTGP